MEVDSFINPFDLLGVTPNSSMREVKSAYMSLSMVCHPDKGGNNADMNAVHSAYVYVSDRISKNKSASLESLLSDFSEFCSTRVSESDKVVVTWDNVYRECCAGVSSDEYAAHKNTPFDNKKFEETFLADPGSTRRTVCDRTFIPCANIDGYGGLMDISVETTDSRDPPTIPKTGVTFTDDKRIIRYEEPESMPGSNGAILSRVDRVNDIADVIDYGCGDVGRSGGAEMFDYKQAYSEPPGGFPLCEAEALANHPRLRSSHLSVSSLLDDEVKARETFFEDSFHPHIHLCS